MNNDINMQKLKKIIDDIAFLDASKYPLKREYESVYLYKNGEKIFTGSHEEFKDFNIEKGMIKEVVLDEYSYNKNKEKYNNEKNNLLLELKKLAFECYELEDIDDQIKEAIWYQAYKNGHSAGYYEVINCMADFVTLAKQIIQKYRK